MDILKETAACFNDARKNLISGAALLHKISSQSLYKPSYESFNDYLDQECHISPSFASKLISVFQAYVIEGQVKKSELVGIDHEKLYLAIGMKGSFAEKVQKASLLSRSELKQELAEKDGVDCKHPTVITICSSCHARV